MLSFSARIGWLANITGVRAHIENEVDDYPAVAE